MATLNYSEIVKNLNRVKNSREAAILAKRQLSKPYLGSVLTLTSRAPIGRHVFDSDWDLLIILDGCRTDAIAEVAPEYSFIENFETVWSVGGSSAEWIIKTFDDEYRNIISDTGYIASNAFAKFVLYDNITPEKKSNIPLVPTNWDQVNSDDVGRIEHCWPYEKKDEKGVRGHLEGHSPPDYVTDRAISMGRNHDYDRIIAHYGQPHQPYTSLALSQDRDLYEYEIDPFGYLRRGGDFERVWKSYINDVRYVLDEVSDLIQNIDAENVVISADHGGAFGEFYSYGHLPGSLNPYIRRVPWIETEAQDNKTRHPNVPPILNPERYIE
jgi:hypothetical protein